MGALDQFYQQQQQYHMAKAAARVPYMQQQLAAWTTVSTDTNTFTGTLVYGDDLPEPPATPIPLSGKNVRWLTERVDDLRVKLH